MAACDEDIQRAMSNYIDDWRSAGDTSESALQSRLGRPGTIVLTVAVLLAAMPMSLPELVLGALGVVAYLALHLSRADQHKHQEAGHQQ